VVGPIAAKLTQTGHERGPGVLELAVDPQSRVPRVVPADAFIGRHRGLERIEDLIGARSRLTSLKIDDARRHCEKCR
jgi:hypothetical protein